MRALAIGERARATRLAYAIADAESTRDSEKIRTLVYELAETAPDLAEQLARSIPAADDRSRALGELAESWLPQDRERAEQLANLIPNEEDRDSLLRKVAQAWAPVDPERALEVLDTVAESINPWATVDKALAMTAVAEQLTKCDRDRAQTLLEAAHTMADSDTAVGEPSVRIAIAQAYHTFDSRLARELLDQSEKILLTLAESAMKTPSIAPLWNSYVARGVRTMARRDPQGAEHFTLRLPDRASFLKAGALIAVAETLINQSGPVDHGV